MILKKLYISENTQCDFHNGLNIILGRNHKKTDIDNKKISDANGIGKTTLVKSICYVLGGDTVGAFNSEFFKNKSYWASLAVQINKKDYVLSRPLWEPLSKQAFVIYTGTFENFTKVKNKHQISFDKIKDIGEVNRLLERLDDFKVYSKEEAVNFISKLLNLDYSKSNIKISGITDFLIRDEMLGFSSVISRQQRKERIQYRAAQYLFGLPATIEEQADKIVHDRASILEQINAIKEYLDEMDIKDINSIQNKDIILKDKLKKIQKNLEDYKLKDSIEEVRKQYSVKRRKLIEVNSELNYLETQKDGYLKNLKELKEKSSSVEKLIDVKGFYEELLGYFPENLSDNFDSYKSFIESISSDRKDYYIEVSEDLKSKIKASKKEKNLVQKSLEELTKSLNTTNIVTDLSTIVKEESSVKNSIKLLGDAEKKLDYLETLEEKAKKLKTNREELIKKGKKVEKQKRSFRAKIIQLFHDFVSHIYPHEIGNLSFEYNDNLSSSIAGRTEILCSIQSQQSKGRTHAKVCIFDYVWFFRKRTKDEYNPQFLIHDGPLADISPEPKERMLSKVIEMCEEQSKQYIVTLNDAEIDNLNKFKDYVCHELDGSKTEGKLFGEQYE